ncbi:MAG: glycosyltransferase [Bacteroidales bacterium]|nr:glycosyltransferase [Bacteroidales bacterium]MCM1147045.1 glycosyltransferase [Bacteroidales bacterium]MCM1205822.1 glycosyltransferase [Bacillota bacterium]MCM1509934.1 glycosyltransferase [Clostridium sp.]
MTKNIKLSIILPCYHSENCIENIINDSCNQTVGDWELLVISNGEGREKQEKVIEHFLSDRRIKLISLALGNVSNARNVGMETARGEWLSFVDSDDRILPNHFEMMLDNATEDIDMVVCGFLQIFLKNKKEWRISLKSRENLVRCLPYGWAYPWNKLFRTSTVRNWGGTFDVRLTYQEDAVFIASFMAYTKRINVVNECTI